MATKKQPKRRLKNADEAFMGPKPNYGPHNPVPESKEDREKEWRRATHWFYYFENKKKAAETVQFYASRVLGFDKKQINNLKKIPDWKYRMKSYRYVEMVNNGWEGYPITDEMVNDIHNHLKKCENAGSKIRKELDKKPKPVVISPAERTRRKVLDTIYHDFDNEIVEGWFDEDYTKKFSAYNRWKLHGLKGNAINMFKTLLEAEYLNVKDAYDKTCDQCVEAYSHISKGNKRKILKQFEEIFEDLEKLKLSFKAARTPRTRKPKSSDAQVAKLQYCAEDIDSKLTSINPIMIPGKHKLYVYNVKQRRLAEYVTTAINGFEISGTSIKNFDQKESRTATIRKPDDILPQILSKTEKQIDKVWDTITTKITNPTGRINSDCILMRTF